MYKTQLLVIFLRSVVLLEFLTGRLLPSRSFSLFFFWTTVNVRQRRVCPLCRYALWLGPNSYRIAWGLPWTFCVHLASKFSVGDCLPLISTFPSFCLKAVQSRELRLALSLQSKIKLFVCQCQSPVLPKREAAISCSLSPPPSHLPPSKPHFPSFSPFRQLRNRARAHPI